MWVITLIRMSEIMIEALLGPEIPGRLTAYVTDIHPLLIMLIGMIVGGFLLLVPMLYYIYQLKKKAGRQLEELTGYFKAERLQTESILEDIGLGVMAYSPDGRLRVANKAMKDLLENQNLPEQLADFLTQYGEDNGLKTSALLGAPVCKAELKLGKKIIALQLRESSEPDIGVIAKIVVAQDISREREEEQRRKAFVANVSHELKTPLTIIKTYSESLLDWGVDEKSSEAVKSDLSRILDDVNRMETLIEDLLLLSTLDSRGKVLHMEENDLAKLTHQAVERCELQAEDKGIYLNCFATSGLPNVFIDRKAIERVLLNIIQNAIKYTDKGGRIDVFVTRVWKDVVVKVKDNGRGIDPKHQKAIFERFYRVDNTGSRQYGGTGLGLAIAKELTELHHGTISLSSALTRGSEFSINLPTAASIYEKVMLSLVQPDSGSSDDVLLRAAENELLQQASEMGMKAKTLEDLTRAEREKLMAPYRGSKEVEADMTDDFANVLRHDRKRRKPETETEPPAEAPAPKDEAPPEGKAASAEGEAELRKEEERPASKTENEAHGAVPEAFSETEGPSVENAEFMRDNPDVSVDKEKLSGAGEKSLEINQIENENGTDETARTSDGGMPEDDSGHDER